VRDEHERIREDLRSLDSVEAAHELGALLHDHVRFEERRLFALLEARLPEHALERLGAPSTARSEADVGLPVDARQPSIGACARPTSSMVRSLRAIARSPGTR
jgi:hypothetical protein